MLQYVEQLEMIVVSNNIKISFVYTRQDRKKLQLRSFSDQLILIRNPVTSENKSTQNGKHAVNYKYNCAK